MHKRANTHRRRRSHASRKSRRLAGPSRRLRMEGMEGRLMLATTGVDFAPLNLTVAQFDLNSTAPSAVVKYTISDAAGHQGGFINTPYSSGSTAIDFSGNVVPSVPRITLPDGDVSISTIPRGSDAIYFEPAAPAETGFDGQEYGGLPLDTNLDSPTEVLINGPQAGGFELQPSVIPIWDITPHGPHLDSGIVRVRPEAMRADEGGLIQIESVLVGMATLAGPELQDIVTNSPSESDPDDAGEPFRLAATPSNVGAISGELARAMAFELAGGEPADSATAERTAPRDAAHAPDGTPQPMPREPLSSAFWWTRDEVGQLIPVAATHASMATAQAVSAIGLIGGFVPHLQQVLHPVVERTVGLSAASANEPNIAVPAIDSIDSAQMLAFEGLAADEAAARSSLGLEFSLRGALNATPLLMILALERIAASNSRRANRDERCPTALPLRRAKK